MSMRIPAVLADVLIGVLVSGVILGGLVPALGTAASPVTAWGVGLATVVVAIIVGRAIRLSRGTGDG